MGETLSTRCVTRHARLPERHKPVACSTMQRYGPSGVVAAPAGTPRTTPSTNPAMSFTLCPPLVAAHSSAATPARWHRRGNRTRENVPNLEQFKARCPLPAPAPPRTRPARRTRPPASAPRHGATAGCASTPVPLPSIRTIQEHMRAIRASGKRDCKLTAPPLRFEP